MNGREKVSEQDKSRTNMTGEVNGIGKANGIDRKRTRKRESELERERTNGGEKK